MAGKSVIDFGIGGGILGEELLTRHGIRHYTGIDISNRSLYVSRQRLHRLRKRTPPIPSTQWDLHRAPYEFRELHADVFICMAVIQHFPSRAHTLAFFANLERSGIASIVLQIKFARKPTFLIEEDAFDLARFEAKATTATMLNTAFVVRALPSYKLVWQRPPRPSKLEEPVFIELLRTR